MVGAIFLAYAGAVYALSVAYGFEIKFLLYNRVSLIGVLFLVLSFSIRALYVLAKDRPSRPFEHLGTTAVDVWDIRDKIIFGLPYLVLVTIFFGLYSSLKNAIPSITQYYFDPSAANLDRMLHGADPWRLSHYFFGDVLSTWMIGVTYGAWVIVAFGTTAFSLFHVNDRRLRDRFIISLLLSWSLLGSVLGTAFASVGPCYYQFFYDDDRFVPLMSRLDVIDQNTPLLSLATQHYLIEAYQAAAPKLGAGISAFPSMHVGMAMLVCLFAWRFGRFWKIAGTLFVVTILVGSVHLGWHYAIDGYASLIVVWFTWIAVGHMIEPHVDGEKVGDTLAARSS